MHPIERLRYIARSNGGDPRALVAETADALRALDDDPAGLVVACRRIVERHPTSGPLWWLCAHLLTDTDPRAVARRLTAEILDDRTADHLAAGLPTDATVCVVGWSDLISEALLQRDDLTVSAVGPDDAVDLLTNAVVTADLVVMEALAASADDVLVPVGGRAAASVAYCSQVPAWVAVGVGRQIPQHGFQAVVDRVADRALADVVQLGLCSFVVTRSGVVAASEGMPAESCPSPPELTRR